MEKLLRLTDEELKKQFIKDFGIQKSIEEEKQTILNIFVHKICKDYLANIEPIPVVFDHTIKCTALYHFELNAIILHPKNINDANRLLISVLHELEHYFQWIYVSNFNTPKAKRWAKEIQNYQTDKTHYYKQEIELDAIAFSQVVMLEEFNIIVESNDVNIQKAVNKYKPKLLDI